MGTFGIQGKADNMSVIDPDFIEPILNLNPHPQDCPHEECDGWCMYKRTIKGYDKFVCNKCDAVVLNK